MSRHFSPVGVSLLALGAIALAVPGIANADSTEDYPIPARTLHTSCTAEQLLAAARDYEPTYDERYMIDMHNKPANVQQSAKDGIHYFLSLDYAGRRDYAERMATNFADPLTTAWPNWAKVFFNNKGVAAAETDTCAHYPPDDKAVWHWS